MIRIRDIALPPQADMDALVAAAARLLRIDCSQIQQLDLRKKSIDARKKQNIRIIYTVDVQVKGKEEKILKMAHCPKALIAKDFSYQVPENHLRSRPVVVGFGPAGMFCALVLAMAGARPIVLERGQDAETRQKKVHDFWRGGALDTECNVQFGEGGAGTFSDGKLQTGTKNERISWILEQFADCGAGEQILYDAKPHIGTDRLIAVVQNLRERIISLGGEVYFGAKMTNIVLQKGAVSGIEYVQLGQKHTVFCTSVALCIGHSARDTFEMLLSRGVPMEPKPFSMGVRIEQKQKAINEAQYGAFAADGCLPPADYKLNVHLPDGTSAYTFCMCPGGKVVASASEEGGVVTNGMSDSRRDGENANAALLVTLSPEDFPSKDTLGGMYWQREIEQAAFRAGGGDYRAPAQTVGAFLGQADSECTVAPSYQPGVQFCDLHAVLPERITKVLEQALPELDRKLPGFASPGCVMTAPETRSSSPVRILRDEKKMSKLVGLYPCGEGAGYAGGIMSAAVDGMLCAEEILKK